MLRFLLFAFFVAGSLGAATLRRPRPRLDSRIAGGHPVTIEEFPYQLSYEYSGRHMCGASIISPDWVVTAAHCTDGYAVSSSRFRAGSSIREQGGSLHPASQFVQNPRYDYYTMDFDIAVARVSIPFTYGTVVQPIAMTHSQPVAGSLAVVSGWGAVSAGGPYSMQLQAVEIYIVSREECNSAYADYGGITGYMICAGVTGGGKGPCQGDSGGPLVVGGQLVGIVSWGYGCAEFAYPGVYSDVASLRSFVTDTTGVQ